MNEWRRKKNSSRICLFSLSFFERKTHVCRTRYAKIVNKTSDSNFTRSNTYTVKSGCQPNAFILISFLLFSAIDKWKNRMAWHCIGSEPNDNFPFITLSFMRLGSRQLTHCDDMPKPMHISQCRCCTSGRNAIRLPSIRFCTALGMCQKNCSGTIQISSAQRTNCSGYGMCSCKRRRCIALTYTGAQFGDENMKCYSFESNLSADLPH